MNDFEEVMGKMELKIGHKYKIFYSEGNLNNKTIHIRGIVDGQYVVCKWRKTKKYYRYFVESPYYFYYLLNDNHITHIGKSNIKLEE